jgi:hypothetical protein
MNKPKGHLIKCNLKVVDTEFRDHLVSIMGKVASRYPRPMIFEEDFMEVAILIEEYRSDKYA